MSKKAKKVQKIADAKKKIFPVSAAFFSKLRVKTFLFFYSKTAKSAFSFVKSFNEKVLNEPVNVYYFAILNTFLLVAVLSISR